jgi:hypothetical protein
MLLRFFRFAATVLFAIVVVPILGEFAVELVREHGFYEHPTATLEAVMRLLTAIREHPWFLPTFCFVGGLVIGMWLDAIAGRARKSKTTIDDAAASKTGPPQIEILFEKRAPYEESDVISSHVCSTARIGIKNSGGGALSNCKIYIDKITPEPPHPNSFPLLLDDGGFIIRHDDPEKLFVIATCWDHHIKKQFRFNTTMGAWGSPLYWTDGTPVRAIVVKVEATECQRTATFRIWTDDTQTVRMERVS